MDSLAHPLQPLPQCPCTVVAAGRVSSLLSPARSLCRLRLLEESCAEGPSASSRGQEEGPSPALGVSGLMGEDPALSLAGLQSDGGDTTLFAVWEK